MPPETNATALLQLMQLASPALPVGGFSYSEGLEAAVDCGRVGNEAQAGDWLLDQLHLSLERADLAVVAAALPAWQRNELARIEGLNQWVLLTRESAEFRQQALEPGEEIPGFWHLGKQDHHTRRAGG